MSIYAKKGFALIESLLLLQIVSLLCVIMLQTLYLYQQEVHREQNFEYEEKRLKEAYE